MKEFLLTTLENSKTYTLAVAEAMPEKNYSFKPTAPVWSFLEQLHHIGYGISLWQDNYIQGVKTDWSPTAVSKEKKEAIDYLNKNYDSLKQLITKGEVNENFIKGFQATIDHITHHRGQAIIYLRCNGIDAPEYVF